MPNLDFFIIGQGETILFLHGWGQNKEMMLPVVEKLKYKYKCIVIDMPGFGNSKFNNENDINEYCETIHDFLLLKLKINPKYIVGHSFGGKVAIEYYLKYKSIKGIILIASPILKPKKSLKCYYNIYKYKLLKRFNKNINSMGSSDYKNTSKTMKTFFVNVVNTHYNKEIKRINIPLLLIYSKEDEKVEFKKAKKLHKKLKKSRLEVIKGDHFAYLNNENIIGVLINNFFRENEKKREYYL